MCLAASRSGCEPVWLRAVLAASRTGCKPDWQDWALLEHYDQANPRWCLVLFTMSTSWNPSGKSHQQGKLRYQPFWSCTTRRRLLVVSQSLLWASMTALAIP